MSPDQICMGCMREHGGAAVCPHCGWREDQPPASPVYLPPRTVLADQFMIGRVLGHGGFGVLYIAWDLRLHRKLAVKEYMPQGIAGRAPGQLGVSVFTNQEDYQWGLDRFLDEARVVAKFSDRPDIISVINYFAENDTAYMVTEYLDGRTLLQYVEGKGGRISYDVAVRILTPVMDALREIHKTGILHRDVSPDNIFLTNTGLVKVLDFGAARQALGQKSKNLSVILKEGYAPEEQYRTKGNQGQWTDVYATAATLYRVITGKVPPPATDRSYHDEIEMPSALDVAIPPAAEANLIKALSVRAEHRFQSMEEFQRALLGETAPMSRAVPVQEPMTRPAPAPQPRTVVTQLPPSTKPVAPVRAFPKWVWAAAAAAVVLLAVALIYRLGRDKGADNPATTEKPGVEQQVAGKWSTTWTDGTTQNICEINYETDGRYSFAGGCPPALLKENGLIRIYDGTFRIISNNTERKDWGTYQLVGGSRLDMKTPGGATTEWVREQATETVTRQETPPAAQTDIPSTDDPRNAPYTEPPRHNTTPPRQTDVPARPVVEPPGNTNPNPVRETTPPPAAPPVAMDTPASLLKKAGDLMRGRRAEQALPLLKQVLETEPNNADAHAALGYIYLYNEADINSAGTHCRQAFDAGGTVTFHLKHDLGDGMFARYRTGSLRISKSKVSFSGDDGVPVFNGPLSSVVEAKFNSKVTRFFRGVRAPSSFHVKIGGDNYNLAPMSASHRQEADLILSFLPGS